MSDNEDSDYYSEKSDSDSEPEINSKKSILKPPIGLISDVLKKNGPNIDDDDNDDDDNEEDADDGLIGGVGDDDEPEDILSIGSSDDEVEDDEEEEEESADVEENTNTNKTPETKKANKNKKPVQIELPSDDEDEDYDDSYLQKFDNEVTKNYITDFHPECLIQNYDEITKLTIVVRDSNNIIIDPLHKTIPFLTKYEKARILGQRSKQIETGARPFISVPENVIDGYVIAELELQQKRIPFIIRRPIPGGAFEYWNIRDLEVISF